MDQRIYHGSIKPIDLAQSLVAKFNRGNYRVQQIGLGDQISVQIALRNDARAGGSTALGINIQQLEDGVSVQVGKQTWYGIAASVGKTALSAILNPFTLINRIDDLAQDFESVMIVEEVWKTIDACAKAQNAGQLISERLRLVVCEYCDTANGFTEPSCVACGAPLCRFQPIACGNCGFILPRGTIKCTNCGAKL